MPACVFGPRRCVADLGDAAGGNLRRNESALEADRGLPLGRVVGLAGRRLPGRRRKPGAHVVASARENSERPLIPGEDLVEIGIGSPIETDREHLAGLVEDLDDAALVPHLEQAGQPRVLAVGHQVGGHMHRERAASLAVVTL